jgi:hypothetical protein
MIQPAYDACRSGGYHVMIALSGAIRHAHTPAPITARASAARQAIGEREQRHRWRR